jgi:hypothetical protein
MLLVHLKQSVYFRLKIKHMLEFANVHLFLTLADSNILFNFDSVNVSSTV